MYRIRKVKSSLLEYFESAVLKSGMKIMLENFDALILYCRACQLDQHGKIDSLHKEFSGRSIWIFN